MISPIYAMPEADDLSDPGIGFHRSRVRQLIREGHLVDGPRQCGKTTALLEVLHEDHAGKAVLIVVNGREGEIYDQRYCSLFPDSPRRPIICLPRASLLWGQDRVYVDGLWRMPDWFQVECRRSHTVVVGVA